MTADEDIRSRFYLDSFIDGHSIPAKVAERLVSANVGYITVGDVQRRTLDELRKAMTEAAIPKSRQDRFIEELRESRVYPAGVTKAEDFCLN